MNQFTKANYSKLISALIEGLPQRDQLILSLFYVEGLSFAEIGRTLSIPETCVQDNFVKAVRSCLGPIQPNDSSEP